MVYTSEEGSEEEHEGAEEDLVDDPNELVEAEEEGDNEEINRNRSLRLHSLLFKIQ